MYRSKHLRTAILAIAITVHYAEFAQSSEQIEEISETCNLDDLNHSVLVECNITSCGTLNENEQKTWPTSEAEIIHIFSSKAGARFSRVDLPNLNYEESPKQKLLDINTTLTVYRKMRKPKVKNKLIGFGATLNLAELTGDFENSHALVLEDLIGDNARIEILRLSMNASTNYPNLGQTLMNLDQFVARARNYDTQRAPLKLVLDVQVESLRDGRGQATSSLVETIQALSSIDEKLSSVSLWAISFDDVFLSDPRQVHREYLELTRKSLPRVLILASVPMVRAPEIADRFSGSPHSIDGLLLMSQTSVPYNVLEYLRPKFNIILTVGRKYPKTRDYGDWDNAQVQAIEILNHLRYNSMGFIENLSTMDILSKSSPNQDCSLYNLQSRNLVHFRGPMFYATGHFSRYLSENSELLEISVFTQPNMFAAHYSAFITPGNFLVAVILNSNDHLLPFRLELDNRILAFTHLEPKSFNTILVKL